MNAITPAGSQQLPDYLRITQDNMSEVDTLGAAFESRAFARVSTKDNRFTLVTIDGEEQAVNQLDQRTGAFYLDIVFLNWAPHITKTWYAQGYTAGADDSPDCFSMDGVHPDPASPTPQHTACAACPKNAFGSATNGRGKACADGQRTAIVLAADTPVIVNGAAAVEKAGETVFGYRLPPMTGKNLREKVNTLKKSGINIKGVILRAHFVAQGEVDFTPMGFVSPEFFAHAQGLAKSEDAERACGLNPPAAPAALALGAPPAYAALAATEPAPALPPPAAAPAQPAAAPVAQAPAPAPVQPAAAPAPARRRGRPAAATAPAVAPTPAQPVPTMQPTMAAQPAQAPAPAAAPTPAASAVIQQPQATNAELDALLAAAMGGQAA